METKVPAYIKKETQQSSTTPNLDKTKAATSKKMYLRSIPQPRWKREMDIENPTSTKVYQLCSVPVMN